MSNIGNLMYMGRKKLKNTVFKENKRWGINFSKRLPNFNMKSMVKAVPGNCSAKWVRVQWYCQTTWRLQVRMNGLKGKVCSSTGTTQLLQDGSFLLLLFLFCFSVLFGLGSSFKFDFGLSGRFQGQMADLRGWEDKRDQNVSREIHKESIKGKQKWKQTKNPGFTLQ